MPAVAFELLGTELPVAHNRIADVFPARNATGHGRSPAIAHLTHGFGSQQGAFAASTVHHNVLVCLWYLAGNLKFEKPTRYRDCPLNVAAADFVLLSYIK